jgi:parallel beta-helix repeat protein
MSNITTVVKTAAQLLLAIKLAKGGETILLAPGDYGHVAFRGSPASNVTIKSLDPDNDAVFHSLKMVNVSNFTIQDVDVCNPQDAGAPNRAIQIGLASNITLIGVDVSGSKDGTAWNDGYGIMLTDSNHVAILDSTFQQLHGAITAGRVTDLIVAGNDISQAREGVQVGQIDGGLFDRNYLHNMDPNYAAGDHADNFQVHNGNGIGASNNLVFTNNVMIEDGGGWGVHGIYINSERYREGIQHTNIIIENNYFQGSSLHGISVNYADNVVIRNNTLTSSGSNDFYIPAILARSIHGGIIENNAATLLLDVKNSTNTDLVWSNNIDLWDPKFKKGVALSDVFVAAGDGEIDFSNFDTKSTGVAAGIGFHAVAGIGDVVGSADAIMAAYLPRFDHNFVTQMPIA